MSSPVPLLCARCGAPLGPRQPDQRCTYCNAVQVDPRPPQAELAAAVRDVLRQDRDGDGVPDVLVAPRPAPAEPPPSSSPWPALGLGAGIVLSGVLGMVVFLVSDPAPKKTTTPRSTVTVTATTPPPMPAPSSSLTRAEPVPTTPTTPTTQTTAPSKPAPTKLTNEQFGKNVVAAQHKKLLECVEQDLLRNPSAPRAYTVTVLVERDGLPKNSATTFSPTPSPGFQTCGKFAIFYGFNGYGRNSPEQVEYTFTTSFAFPNAKPATKASTSWE